MEWQTYGSRSAREQKRCIAPKLTNASPSFQQWACVCAIKATRNWKQQTTFWYFSVWCSRSIRFFARETVWTFMRYACIQLWMMIAQMVSTRHPYGVHSIQSIWSASVWRNGPGTRVQFFSQHRWTNIRHNRQNKLEFISLSCAYAKIKKYSKPIQLQKREER